MIRLDGSDVYVNVDAVMVQPELDSDYRDKNPVRFLSNQILHLGNVLRIIEDLALTYYYGEKDSPQYRPFVAQIEAESRQLPRAGYVVVAMRAVEADESPTDALNRLTTYLARGAASANDWEASEVSRETGLLRVAEALACGQNRQGEGWAARVVDRCAAQFGEDARFWNWSPETDQSFELGGGRYAVDEEKV